MILTLCLLAFLLALSLSLLYTASQVMSNADKRENEIRAEQMAESISQCLQTDAQDQTSEFYQSLQTLCSVKTSLKPGTSTRREYALTLEDLPGGYTATVTYERGAFSQPGSIKSDWWTADDSVNCGGSISVTIRTEYKGAEAARTDVYQCSLPAITDGVSNQLTYYVEENGRQTIVMLNENKTFSVIGGDSLKKDTSLLTLEDAEKVNGVIEFKIGDREYHKLYRKYENNSGLYPYVFTYEGGMNG